MRKTAMITMGRFAIAALLVFLCVAAFGQAAYPRKANKNAQRDEITATVARMARVGNAGSPNFSPDGKWAIVVQMPSSPPQLVLVPTGAGEARQLTDDAINHIDARWFPDGNRILFLGNERGRGTRLFVQDIQGGAARPLTPEGVARIGQVSPDGKFVEIAELPGHPWYLAVQFHPEFRSKPLHPHPLFASFVEASFQHRMALGQRRAAETVA